MGGTKEMGYYLIFRGDIQKVGEMINEAHAVFNDVARKYMTQNN